MSFSLSELTPNILNLELTHSGLEASIYNTICESIYMQTTWHLFIKKNNEAFKEKYDSRWNEVSKPKHEGKWKKKWLTEVLMSFSLKVLKGHKSPKVK